MNLTRYISRLERFLPTAGHSESEPGYVGRVPYLIVLRWLVYISIPIRYSLQHNQYPYVKILTASSALLTLVSALSVLQWKYPQRASNQTLQFCVCLLDVLAISYIYLRAGEVRSDVYLLYCLPILSAFEYLTHTGIGIILTATSIAFLSVLWCFWMSNGHLEALAILFVTRQVFFLSTSSFAAFIAWRSNSERNRQRLNSDTLISFKEAVDQLFDITEVLEHTAYSARALIEGEVAYILSSDEAFSAEQKERLARFAAPPSIKNKYSGCQKVMIEPSPQLAAHNFTPSRLAPSIAIVPLPTLGRTIGPLVITSSIPGRYSKSSLGILETLAQLSAGAINRARVLSAFAHVSQRMTVHSLNRDDLLESILRQVENIGFDMCAISLVDEFRNCIEMTRGRNIAPGWKRRSKYDLSDRDILASVARARTAEVIEGFDPRFNREIYDRFDHRNLTRAYVPIIGTQGVVAVLEAGCDSDRRSNLFTEANMTDLQRIAADNANALGLV